jgi:ribonuclease-3
LKINLPFFRKRKSDEELELTLFILKRFGYRPLKLNHFFLALKHKSLSPNSDTDSNERLEFLGDAILDAVIAEYFFERFPEADEGHLTRLKSRVVNRKTLSDIGEAMQLKEVLKYQKGRSINLSTLEGNAFEALIGAIYLDGGFEATRKAIRNYVLTKYIDLNRVLEEDIDFKSKLYMWCQKRKLKLHFASSEKPGKNGQLHYTIVVQINGTPYGKSESSSKKNAEQLAAKETLILMGEA